MLAQMSCSESDPEGKLLARQRSHLRDLEVFLIRPITPHSSGYLIGPTDDSILSFPAVMLGFLCLNRVQDK